jgi:signal transduction histidine kinase
MRSYVVYNEKEDGVYVCANGAAVGLLNKRGLQSQEYPVKLPDGMTRGSLVQYYYRFWDLPGISDSLVLCALPGYILKKKHQAAETYFELGESDALGKTFPPWQAVLDFTSAANSPIEVATPNFFLFEVQRNANGLWILGTNYGVFLVQERPKPFKHLPGTEGRPVRGMLQHRANHLLIASTLETIDYDLRKQKGHSFPELHNVWNFLPIGKDSLLCCVETFDGLYLLHFPTPDQVRITIPSFSDQFGFTRSMAQTPGGIWTGNFNSHLVFLPTGGKPPEVSPYNYVQEPGKQANAIVYSPVSGLWVGGTDGLHRYSLDAHSGRMTANGSDNLPPLLHTLSINALYESADGKIWIGCSQSGGLYAYEPEKRFLRQWDTSDGLSDNTIYSILGSNGDSLLWLGTQSGLSRMDVPTSSFRNFYAEDGLEQNEFNTAARYLSPDGTFYFGGMNGVSYFRPEWMPAQTAPVTAYLKIQVLDLKTQRRRQLYPNAGETVVFAPNEQYIQLDIRSNDLFHATEIKARYKIEGIGKEWRTASALEKITLTGLPADDYHLTVQVQALNGNWSEPFVITLKICPFWYNTWWFRTLLLVLAICVTLYGAYRIRIRQIKKEYDLRKQLSDDLHDELGGRIFAMKALASQIAKPKLPENERRDIAEQFENLSKNVMGRVRDFIWTFDPQNDALSEFLDRLQGFTFATIRPVVNNVRFERDVPGDLVFATPARHHIMMVFQEILTNMVKHTRSQKIEIAVRIKAQHLRIQIVNEHTGIWGATEDTSGHGLSSIENRLQKHDIGLTWEKTPNTQVAEITYKMTNHV